MVRELVSGSGVQVEVGIVQTAYANGSSTNYIANVLVSVLFCNRFKIVAFHF